MAGGRTPAPAFGRQWNMHPFIEKILASAPLLTDGAWGTQLQARGLASGEFPDGWNLTHPDLVGQVARAYVEAGSQIILTNTFGANRVRLAGHETLVNQVADINRCGVEISREATAGQAHVFASMGPCGKLMVTGEIQAPEVRAAFEEQARALAEAGADAIVVETMADLQEAKIAVAAAKATNLPVVGCMVFDSGKNKDRTMMGATPEQAAQGLAEAGADVIGANCGQGIDAFVGICQRLRAATQQPIWLKPNAGLPQYEDGRPVYRTLPESFALLAPELVKAGASFLGGCCGTTPEFIKALKTKLQPAAPPSA